MQANIITLSVDEANDGVTVATPYERFDETHNRSGYATEAHTLEVRDILQLYRTPQKRNGEYKGSAKSSVKFTHDVTVSNASGSGDIVVPLIVEVNFSVPVGTSAADTLKLRQRAVALLDDDSVMADLVDKLYI